MSDFFLILYSFKYMLITRVLRDTTPRFVGPLVGRSVGWLVDRSVGPLFTFFHSSFPNAIISHFKTFYVILSHFKSYHVKLSHLSQSGQFSH